MQCISVSDFNLPKIDWANDFFPCDFKSQTFFTFYSDFGFQQLINEGTRRSNILDLLLTNDPLLISDFAVEAPFINSDLESITWIIIAENVSSDLFSNAPAPVFNWKLSDWDSFSLYFLVLTGCLHSLIVYLLMIFYKFYLIFYLTELIFLYLRVLPQIRRVA